MVFSLFRRHVLQPERRRDPRRLVIDGRIAFGGRVYPLKDWSHRGFAASGVGADHCPGDRLLLTAEIPLTDETLCFDCRGVVVWVDHARKELAVTFLGLDYRIERKIRRGLFPGGKTGSASCMARGCSYV